jgi:predicted hotdog family 3-hydroxylacyl-ACP dehydratase
MRFVDEVEADLHDGVICAVRVPEGSPFAAGEFAPALVALEMAAQAAATFEARGRLAAGQPRGARVGYLVGAREVRFARAQVRAAERLSASVRLAWASPPLSTYAFDVSCRGEVVAAGQLSAWLSPTDA